MVLNYLVFSKKIQQNLKKNLKTFKLIFLCKKKKQKKYFVFIHTVKS
jgi:hypothetical protein